MITASHYIADTYVTAANPAPGRQIPQAYPVRSGTGWGEAYTTRSDGGIGVNVYIAGGNGPSGSTPTVMRDQTGAYVVVTTDGNRSLAVSDGPVFNVLSHILVELKRINAQLAEMTGEEIETSELEE